MCRVGVCCLAVLGTVQALVVTFSGNVPSDFREGPGVLVASDATSDVFFTHAKNPTDPYSPIVNDQTGWNIYDVRFAYDGASDTAFVGKRDVKHSFEAASLPCV